jgi:hypothetical protein
MSAVCDTASLQSLISRHGEIENQLDKLSQILEKGWGFQVTACMPLATVDQAARVAFAVTDDHVRAMIEWQMQSLAIERTGIKKKIAELVGV